VHPQLDRAAYVGCTIDREPPICDNNGVRFPRLQTWRAKEGRAFFSFRFRHDGRFAIQRLRSDLARQGSTRPQVRCGGRCFRRRPCRRPVLRSVGTRLTINIWRDRHQRRRPFSTSHHREVEPRRLLASARSAPPPTPAPIPRSARTVAGQERLRP
jgi:hypothetical protein